MNIFDWIQQELDPQECTSDQFIYDDMESQSGRGLPVIYQPFDPANPSHWGDRGSLFDFLFSTQGEGKKLLDFGPGDGWPSLIVAPFAAEVVGVDGSRRRVEVCTENAKRLGIGNTTFVYNPPGRPLPFADGSFDGVMAASSVEQTPDPRFTLGELYRVLRPGGRLRLDYEALGRYRNGEEQDTWLSETDEERSVLILFDRHIDQEVVRQFGLTLSMPARQVRQHFAAGEKQLPFRAITLERLQALRPRIWAAKAMTTHHPSGKTLAGWLEETGFQQVLPTHSGDRFAVKLFRQLPESCHPADLQGVDDLLWPVVKVAIDLPAPLETDPMITAVK